MPTNSKLEVKGERAGSVDLAKGDPMVPVEGRKPWEVGSVERIRGWLRWGT